MRICFVVHGYPPEERTGVENYTEGLARELSARGHEVHVFTRRADPNLAHLATAVERRDGTTVHWLATNRDPGNEREALDLPGAAEEFGRFLDEVRPEIVHFQHVIKLGIGLLHATKERGIPIVYTTHDFYAICHRFTLLRPDLANCEARQDPAACARCDRAIGVLRGFELEDYQLGVFEHELTEEQNDELALVLHADQEQDSEEAARSIELRTELNRLRLEAFRCVDHFVSPSQHLADVLVEGGFEAHRIEAQGNGLELDDLKNIPRPAPLGGRKLRLAYFGGLSKHKGVHDLLEAFDGLQEHCELTVFGYTSDERHLARLEAAAERVGARMAGSYDREEIAGLYEQVDAVVVPSIWSENQPLVIAEAFAAGRPVVTANYGALPENITDDVNGLLFQDRSVDSLRETLLELATEPGLYERLSAGAKAGKDAPTQASELEERYAGLLQKRDERQQAQRTKLPKSLQGSDAKFQVLNELPTDELIRRAVAGLATLRAGFGLPDDYSVWSGGLTLELDSAQELREEARRNHWLESENVGISEELEWRRGSMVGQEETRQHLEKVAADRAEESAWLRGLLDRAEGGRDEMVASFERLANLLEDLGADVSEMRKALAGAREDLAALPVLALEAVKTQARLLENELEPHQQATGDEPQADESPIRSFRRVMGQLHGELQWRRQEMHDLQTKFEGGWIGSLARFTAFGKRVRDWSKGWLP